MNKDCHNIFFITDMDGTFLPSTKIPLEIDMAALNDFKQNGGKFAFATGRILQASYKYLEMGIANAPCVLANGSMIYDPVKKEVLYSENLTLNALSAVKFIYENFPDVSVEINTPDEVLVCRNNANEMKHINTVGFKNWRETTIEEAAKKTLVKVLFAGEKEAIDKLTEFEKLHPFGCGEFIRSSEHFFEVLPDGVSKGSALKRLREMSPPDTYFVAMGDFYNDSEMLKEADFAVCPSNAEPGVKEICDYICARSCEDGAAAEIIEKIIGESRFGGKNHGFRA
ncbi:MAG: Cof-type HAD-IIB family hydrolase [Ruminococcus sp.]|jgi:Cof subfamily protein (haloacid dehalogenase superfamily)|nr:Cof-type HAD-IIB family hydrolase [Ruminococcus sp.]